MNLSLKRSPTPATVSEPPVLAVKPGDLLRDWQGDYHVVTARQGTDRVILQRFGKHPVPPKTVDPSQFIAYWRDDLTSDDFQVIQRDIFKRPEWGRFEDWGEVRRMADRPMTLPVPPRMTKAEWARRSKTTVTLTKSELEDLAQLLAAGHVLLRNAGSISPKLKTAMTRLGVATKGL